MNTLYPTRFRWNCSNRCSEEIIPPLYIPHGSDETSFNVAIIFLCINFISHTVQMKHVWSSFTKGHKRSLYIPHGSDETSSSSKDSNSSEILYIPHGSDETQITMGIMKWLLFFISHTVQMKPMHIFRLLQFLKAFISHTVQMKPEITTPNII